MMFWQKGARQQGFLLVQQMIVLCLAAILLLMLTTAVAMQWQAFRQQSQLVFLHQTAVQTHALLQHELANAAFWAGLSRQQLATSVLTVSGDCAAKNIDSGSFPLASQDWLPFLAGTVAAANTPACLTQATPQSDYLQLKHLAGDPLTLAELRNNRAYLQQTGLQGRFVSSSDTGLTAQSWYWPYQHELLYVTTQYQAKQMIPVLMRKRLVRNAQGNFVMDTAAILDGVEMMVFELGLDVDGDGQSEQFIPASQLTINQWQQTGLITQLRYFVLLRALQPEPGYRNQQLYRLGQRQFQARGDPYRRLLIRSSVSFSQPR